MRPLAPRLARAVMFTVTAATVSAWSAPSAGAQAGVTLYPEREHMAAVVVKAPGQPGRMWAYWGELKTAAPNAPPTAPKQPWGSYRATCTWIEREGLPAGKSDNRLACTVVIASRDTQGSTVVAEGLLKMPKNVAGKKPALFDRASECSSAAPPKPQPCRPRQLAITGATGVLKSLRGGVVEVQTKGRIAIAPP